MRYAHNSFWLSILLHVQHSQTSSIQTIRKSVPCIVYVDKIWLYWGNVGFSQVANFAFKSIGFCGKIPNPEHFVSQLTLHRLFVRWEDVAWIAHTPTKLTAYKCVETYSLAPGASHLIHTLFVCGCKNI